MISFYKFITLKNILQFAFEACRITLLHVCNILNRVKVDIRKIRKLFEFITWHL